MAPVMAPLMRRAAATVTAMARRWPAKAYGGYGAANGGGYGYGQGYAQGYGQQGGGTGYGAGNGGYTYSQPGGPVSAYGYGHPIGTGVAQSAAQSTGSSGAVPASAGGQCHFADTTVVKAIHAICVSADGHPVPRQPHGRRYLDQQRL